MKNTIVNLTVAIALSFCGAALASIESGRDYKLLAPSQPSSSNRIEAIEFFTYVCSHCYHLHQSMNKRGNLIPSDVNLTYIPVIFNESMEPMARAYYALESLGQAHKLHDPLYRAWHVDNLNLTDDAAIFDFVAAHGVDRARFASAYRSPAIESKVASARQMLERYGIRGTPTLIVDGKYVITGLQPDQTVQAFEEVIALARKSHPHAASHVAEPIAVALATTTESTPPAPVAAPVATLSPDQEPQPEVKHTTSSKRAKAKKMRPKDLDLRHCLELDNNPAIARCARE
jgi:thiol:disulfide interchange protein DsbA